MLSLPLYVGMLWILKMTYPLGQALARQLHPVNFGEKYFLNGFLKYEEKNFKAWTFFVRFILKFLEQFAKF